MSSFLSEIVIGIDFGTTHSGVSWAVNGGAKKVRVINNWPDPKAATATKPKVPSSISYSPGGVPKNWGYNVDIKDECFKWIKVLLEQDSQYSHHVEPVRASNLLLGSMGKSAQEVVTDYLRLLWAYTLQDIRDIRPDFDEDVFDIRVILTVPAMWSHAAKDKTLQAAKAAGMPNENITLVTEPEAAALATLRQNVDDGIAHVGEAFVVCDAGGGTVDLISYEVVQLRPLKIKECAVGDGGLCGSVFLDLAFKNHIVTLVGESQWDTIKEKHKNAMMRDWELGIKRSFTEDSDREFSLDLRGAADDPKNGILDETITIDMSSLRAVFGHVAGQIENLVSQQIAAVQKKGLNVKAVLLVGGFGESKYLLSHLRNCQQHQNINVYQVNDAWSSICRGATLWGLEHSSHTKLLDKPELDNATVVSRLARYSYGIIVAVPFITGVHLEEDKLWVESEGAWYAEKQMAWLLKRGEEVKEGQVLNVRCVQSLEGVKFFSGGSRQFEDTLYYSSDNHPPSRMSKEIRPLCDVSYEVETRRIWAKEDSFKRNGKKWRNAEFDMNIILFNAVLAFAVRYHGETVGLVTAQYKDSFA